MFMRHLLNSFNGGVHKSKTAAKVETGFAGFKKGFLLGNSKGSTVAKWINDDLLSKLERNPKLLKKLGDPRYSQALDSFQTNPQEAMAALQNDPEVKEFIQEFCGILGDHFNTLGEKEKKVQASKASIEILEAASSRKLGSQSSKPLNSEEDERKLQQIFSDPATRDILADEKIQKLIAALKENPNSAQRMLSELGPEYHSKIQRLIEAGLLGVSRRRLMVETATIKKLVTHLRMKTVFLLRAVQLYKDKHVKKAAKTETVYNDTCFEGRTSLFPCSSVVTGNLLLIIFYALLLGVAAKLISDGAELLLDLGVSANLVGGLILPLLGAVPDSAIIIVSGLGPKEEAQEKLAVGMGTLAGSTIMLLTIAWAGSLVIGRCNLDHKGESIDDTGKGRVACADQGITLLPEFRSGLIIMFVTSSFYIIVQSADWYYGPTNTKSPQPAYVRNSALATMIFCFTGLFAYIGYLMYDSKAAEIRLQRHRKENIQRKVLHHMLLLADRQIFKPKPKISAIQDVEDGDGATAGDDDTDAEDHGISKKYFKAWHMKKGMKNLGQKDDPAGDESEGLIERDGEGASPKSEESEEEEESKTKLGLKSAFMLLGGVALVSIFADPMCDALDALTNKKNKPHYLAVNSFYVSFIVTPFCSNASELVSSLIFASRRKRENATITYSQLFGACTMNNTMCLGIFMALVYFRELEWYYSAEVTVILLVQWSVGLISFMKTYKLYMAVPVGMIYILSLILVFILEKYLHWK
eukprot:Seg1903.3 transcript_id=Seg1903.3/GoldUCD/mRNA.D3Y31 product="Sodium/calcium exchanger NCL2" protein_id=Seg1903.3/GoldUCD/D3Y31